MAERLTTNQEVPGSTPGWIDFLTSRVLADLGQQLAPWTNQIAFLRPINYKILSSPPQNYKKQLLTCS